MCDTIDGKDPEQANPHTERVGSWLSGVGGGGWRWLLIGAGFPFRVMECSALDHGHGCTGLLGWYQW